MANQQAETAADSAVGPRKHPRWRNVVAAVLIVAGFLLTPVAIVSGWARVLLSDTDAFVLTYGPLVSDPGMQDFLAGEVADAIDQRLDIEGTVGEVIDGLSDLTAQRPRAQASIEALREPAVEGIRSTIRTTAARVVTSDAFAEAWRESLRLSHGHATDVLAGTSDLPVSVSEEGLGLHLAPLVEKVKAVLVERGFALAAQLPAVDKTVVIVPASSLLQVQLGYRAVVATGAWLGVLVLALLGGGVLLSLRRRTYAVWAALGLGVGAALVLVPIAIGRAVALGVVADTVVPSGVLQLTFDTVTQAVNDLAFAVLVLAAIGALVAWLTGPFRATTGLRRAYADFTRSVRERGEGYGLSAGRFGEWLDSARVVLRIVVGAIAALVLVLNRPISVGLVLGTAAGALLALVLLSLLERPTAEAAAT